jgi:hypothetical protein
MNNDKLMGMAAARPDRLRQAAYRVITRTQQNPEVQVQAMAVALYATCTALNIDIRQLLESVERMQRDLDGPFVGTFRALQEYARKEIGR